MTCKAWFSCHPDPQIRTRLLANLAGRDPHQLHPFSAVAVSFGFVWFSTPEGHEYWSDIAKIPWGPVPYPIFSIAWPRRSPTGYKHPLAYVRKRLGGEYRFHTYTGET